MSSDLGPKPPTPLGVAVIGCGRISSYHLDAVAAQPAFGGIVAVVDPDLSKAKAVAARYGAPHAFSEMAAVFGAPEVEAVILCTPNDLHDAQAAQAMAAGRHVLVEKPFSETVEGAERIARIADETGLALAVGHTFRHVAAVRHLQDHRHEFGRLRAVSVSMLVHWDGPQAPWWAERGPQEGLILSLYAPHALDFVQLAVGDDDPIRMHVETARHQTRWKGEDEAMILLRYPHDVMASVHVSYNQPYVMNRKTIHFDKATVRIEDGEYLYIDDELVVRPDGPAGNPHRMGGQDGSHYFRTQFREFALAARGLPNRSVLQGDALRLARLNRWIIDTAAGARI